MSWTQWPGGQQAPAVAAAPPLINPAPTVVPPGLPYSATDQWSQMQQQNWQQWAQWQQQYQQWHQQYGAEYQKSMNALAAQQPVVPNLGVPPPLPMEPQPPLPQDEGPKPAPPLPAAVVASQQPPMPQYSTQPPPNTNFSAPPPNFIANPQQDWRSADLDQKRPLGNAEESPAKRQMMNRQGWRAPANPPGQPTQNWQGQNQSNLEELSEAEKKFDKQFAEWEAQFNKWKDQNSGHPDKQQYKEYEKKWEQWRQQLLERREGMRKKRLGLTGSNKAAQNQNFSVPPPPQAQGTATNQAPPPVNPHTMPLQKTPPAPPVPPKEPLLPTPDIFSKPPPDMNDEPLQFKKPEGEHEHQGGTLGFLNTSKSDGIPGLDLVKDGEPEPKEEQIELVPQKGPDLEAISKGINNILGDQKLMSMLSMVTQTQNINQNANTNTMPKINESVPPADQTNLSTNESPNDKFIQSETVQNFDDQTRSSFTLQPNDSEFYRGLPPGNQFSRGGFQANLDSEPVFSRGQPPNERFDNMPFGGPSEDDFRRPPPNRFVRGIDNSVDDFDQNRGPMINRNSGNFDRVPPGHMGRDDFTSNRPGGLGPGRRDSFGTSGLVGMNRDSLVPGGMNRDIPCPGNMNRSLLGPGDMKRDAVGSSTLNRHALGPGTLNRDSFGFGGMKRDVLGLGGMNRDSLISEGMNRDSLDPGSRNRDSIGPGGLIRGSFGQGSMTSVSHGAGSLNRDSLCPGGITRDSFESVGANRDSFGSGGMNRGSLGLGGMNRESLLPGGNARDSFSSGAIIKDSCGPGGIGRDNFSTGGMNKGTFCPPDSLNRGKFGPGMNRQDFGSSGVGNLMRDRFGPGNREDFGPSAQGRQLGALPPLVSVNKDRFGHSGREAISRNNFDPQVSNFGGGPEFGRNSFGNPRDSFGDEKFGPRDGSNFRDRRNSRGEDFDYAEDDYENVLRDGSGFDKNNFGRVPPNQRLADGPGGRRGDFGGPLGDFNNRRDDFDRMSLAMKANERPSVRNERLGADGGNFGQKGDLEDKYEPRRIDRSFDSSKEAGKFDDMTKLPPNMNRDKFPPHSFRDDREPNFRDNFQESYRDEEDDYSSAHPLYNQRSSNEEPVRNRNSFGHSLLDAPEPPRFSRETFDDDQFEEDQYSQEAHGNEFQPEITPVQPPKEELWKPAKVVDYDHKPLKEPEMDILLEPFRMFDYRHKPLDRIPFPERPNWLSDVVRMIPEFDPPIMRTTLIERRLYDDRFEPPPVRRDDRDRYEALRMDDRYRHDRRIYERFSPPPSRGKGYEDDKWSSSRGNRSRSPLRFEKPPPGGDRIDRERADRSGRNRSRERGRDWESKSRHREGGTRDWEGEKEDWKGGSKDWGNKDERRDRGDRVDYRDRGRDWKGTTSKEDGWKNKDKEWEERERQWEEESVEIGDKDGGKDRDARYNRNDRNSERIFERNDYSKRTSGGIFPLTNQTEEKKPSNVTLIEDLINPPGRSNRPPRIVIILRGPPGSGKTFLAKLIKDKEVENGGSAPRILSLDDYFMVEQEKEIMEDGKRIKTKDMVYEFEAEMEESYRISLMRCFRKTITDGYFPFIIVDNVNDKVKHFGEMWSFAKQNGFQVYISQLDLDVQNCTKRNIHNRTEDEIRKCVEGWEDTPSHHPVLDVSFLTQEEPISEVEMEEINSPGSDGNANEEGSEDHLDRSKWDNFDCSINNLARLDGVNKPLRPSRTMEEYLQLDDEWQPAQPTKPGQKRVRWADLEERKQQEKMRAIGFVVGQTDWDRMMDPTSGESALTQTKYIEKAQRRRF